jgi:hypothetical protein
VLHHYRMTPTAFALLPEDEQAFMLGYETFRARQIAEWRAALVGEEDGKSNYTPEAATLMMLAGL